VMPALLARASVRGCLRRSVLRDRGRDRSAVPGWPIPRLEGLEAVRLACCGGFLGPVEEGPAVLRAARASRRLA
jgi:hypothetical protein